MRLSVLSICFSYILFLLLQLPFSGAMAQVNLQVNVMPPYQSNVTEYASRPELILLTLTNTSTNTQHVQLRGSISGSNGVAIMLKEGYRSTSPIVLGPMETKTLNGLDIVHLFEYNNLEVVGISQRDFINGTGLPEGTYDFCIRAFDYNQPGVALSPEEPLGCTMLSITNLEPPTIVAPFNDQEIVNPGIQSFAITWSTPVGAPPHLQYNVRLVELLTDRDPTEAVWSSNPFFERVVNQNTLLYGPAEPALTPGRRYALVVEAQDPLQKAAIRNNGRSEVVVFTYGENQALVGLAGGDEGPAGAHQPRRPADEVVPDKAFATHVVEGTLKWAFREQEHQYATRVKQQQNRARIRESFANQQASMGRAVSFPANASFSAATANLNGSLVNPAAALKADPTVGTMFNAPLIQPALTIPQSGNTATAQPQVPAAMPSTVSASGSLGVGLNRVQSPAQAAPETYALAGATVSIQGRFNAGGMGGRGPTIHVGTAKTNNDGSFSLEITDPSFVGLSDVRLFLVVNMPDFERYEYEIGSLDPDRPDVDAGQHVLVANTFRFQPTFIVDGGESGAGLESDLEVTLYREASEFDDHPYLHREGLLSDQERVTKTINGKEMVAVGKAKATTSGDQLAAFGALFYSSNLWVEVIPESAALKRRTVRLAVTENQVARNEVLVVQPDYKLTLTPPSVSGRVLVKAGQTAQGISGAYVQVGYEADDLEDTGLGLMPLFIPALSVTATAVEVGTGTTPAASPSAPLAATTQTMGFGVRAGTGVMAASPALVDVQGKVNVLPALPELNISDLTYDINAPYTVQTDSAGDFYIGNLPILKPGARYTVRLIRLPTEYSKMAVDPQAREFVISPKPGSTNYQEFVLSPDMVSVTGRLVDGEQQPVRNARLNIKGTTSFVETGDDGTFTLAHYTGDHRLEVHKQGYVALDTELKIGKNATQELGDIGPLARQTGNVRFVVHDRADPGKPLANVTVAAYDTTHQTDKSGAWLLEGIGGATVVTVTPEATSGYVAAQYSIDVPVDGRVTEVLIPLETGVKVFGKVTSNDAAVGSAMVEVDGKPYLKATTNSAGSYSLVVPVGEETIRAGKSGYLAASQQRILQQGEETEINFELQDGGGKDLSTLLGFEIQLESAVPDPDVAGGEIWKGKFVNLQANTSLFEGTSVAELPFEKVHVMFDEDGKARPKDNQVVTATKSLPVKLFDYLPLRLEGDEYLTVRLNPDRKGSIGGKLRVDGQAFQRRTLGIRYGDLGKTYLTPNAQSGIADIEVFHQDGNAGVPELTLQLSRLENEQTSIELYGFALTLNLSESRVSQLGLFLTGSLTTPSFGIVDTMHIAVKELNISKSFGVESLLIDEAALPTLRIGDWAANLGTVQLDEDGFKFSGAIDIDFPYSDRVRMMFEDLRMAKDALYGGTFHLPDVGMKVYRLLSLKTGRNPLSFNRIGETNVFSLGGSAIMQLPKLISKTFEINALQVQTDGKFFIDIPANVSADLGFASLAVNGLDVSNPAEGAPYVSLRGEFKTDIAGFKFEVGNIRFTADARGEVSYAIDKIRASLDVPIMQVDLGLELVDDAEKKGFAGAGSFTIPETPVVADVEFHYHRLRSGGLELGASFAAGAMIPIGSITIDKLGGGFTYASNTRAFSANIKGAISVTGLSSAAKLDNIDLSIGKDPLGVVIEGSVDLVVADVISLSKAQVMLNTPAKKMTISVDAKFEPLPKLAALQLNGDFAVSWDVNDTYAFFGTQVKAALLGMDAVTVDYVMAFNVKNPKTNTDPAIRKYFVNLEEDYNAPVFSGLYLYGNLKTGKRIDWKFDVKWCPTVTVAAHYNVGLQTTFISNFSSNQYFLRLKGDAAFGGSAGLTFFGYYAGVGGNARFCFDIAGGYNNRWHFDGKMGGKLELFAGNPAAECNNYKIIGGVGARVCVDVFAHLKYDNGLSLGGGLGKFNDNNASCY